MDSQKYEGQTYACPADRRLTTNQIAKRIEDELGLFIAHGDDIAFDLVRSHMVNLREAIRATWAFAFIYAYAAQFTKDA